MAGIHYIAPENVVASGPYERDILAQVELLNRQGQIEPLLAEKLTGDLWRVTNSDYPYAVAQVHAARRLGWPTIILTEGDDSA